MAKKERFFAERSSFEAANIEAHLARMGTGPGQAEAPRVGRSQGIDQVVALEISPRHIRESRIGPRSGARRQCMGSPGKGFLHPLRTRQPRPRWARARSNSIAN